MTAQPSPRFWNRIADRYAKSPIADEAAYQEKLRITQSHLQPASEVLEFGCGTGSTALAHAPFVKRILATDLSERMIEIAREKGAGVSNVTFECASVEGLAAEDASFDAVLGLSILHLLQDRDAAIAKVYRLLKPGGVFISSTACLGDWAPWLRIVIPPGRALGFFPLVKIFKADDLVWRLEAAGFVIERDWRPGRKKAVFIVARKPVEPAGADVR